MRLPHSFHNRLTYVGTGIAALGLILFLFLFALHSLTDAAQAPYAGLVIFVLVPSVLLFGAALVPIGMFREWRRWRRTGRHSVLRFPVVDLNAPEQRNAVVVFSVGSLLLLFLSAFGSFQLYEATESVTFCGDLCHSVMHPERTAYQHSPHARVRCVDCHVGPGADWWVRSKLSGLYQVYAVLLDKYPRPIPTPISNLRPAQETCEQCHWPQQFFGGQEKRLIHFLPDEENTRWEIRLLIKTGGGSPETGQTEGIHWHMNIANRIEYIATDDKRQQIPWVRMTDLGTGNATEYASTENPLSEEEIARAEVRRMDCLDCHNRPTHIYRAPSYAVNLALATGEIDATLPSIKQTGVTLLAEEYDSRAAAFEAIEHGVRSFYREKHPAVAESRGKAIDAAVAALQGIYGRNMFPEMKVRWDVYPDDIGHLVFRGCDRCHDGLHESTDGKKTITRECTACHTIIAQGKPDSITFSTAPNGLVFEHPEDIGGAEQVMPCHDCHTGVAP